MQWYHRRHPIAKAVAQDMRADAHEMCLARILLNEMPEGPLA